MDDVVIVDGARTAHGELLGALAGQTAVEFGQTTVQGLRDRNGTGTGEIDWVCLGNSVQASVGQAPARQVVVDTGLDDSVVATTVNEASGSRLRAITTAIDRIDAGRASMCVAGGMESMSNAPYLVRDMRGGRRHRPRRRDAVRLALGRGLRRSHGGTHRTARRRVRYRPVGPGRVRTPK